MNKVQLETFDGREFPEQTQNTSSKMINENRVKNHQPMFFQQLKDGV